MGANQTRTTAGDLADHEKSGLDVALPQVPQAPSGWIPRADGHSGLSGRSRRLKWAAASIRKCSSTSKLRMICSCPAAGRGLVGEHEAHPGARAWTILSPSAGLVAGETVNSMASRSGSKGITDHWESGQGYGEIDAKKRKRCGRASLRCRFAVDHNRTLCACSGSINKTVFAKEKQKCGQASVRCPMPATIAALFSFGYLSCIVTTRLMDRVVVAFARTRACRHTSETLVLRA